MSLKFSIAIVSALAVFPGVGQLQAQDVQFVLPRVQNDASFRTGLAIANIERKAADVLVRLWDEKGQLVRTSGVRIPAGGQIVGAIDAIAGAPAGFFGAAEVISDVELHALGLLFRASDGAPSESPVSRFPSKSLYFNHVAVGAGWATDISLFNTTTQTATAQVTLYDGKGVIAASRVLELPGKGSANLDLAQLFGIRVQLEGHVELVSDQPFVGALSFHDSFGIATVPADPELRPGVSGKWTSVFPYIDLQPGRWTGISLVNHSLGPAVLTVKLNEFAGRTVASRTVVLPGKGQTLFNVADLAPAWQGLGYLVATSDVASSGLAVVADTHSGKSRISGFAAIRSGAREAFIPHVAETSDWSSKLSVINLTASAAQLEVQLNSASGQPMKSVNTTLAPGEQLLSPLRSLLQIADQADGTIRVISSSELLVANLYSNSSGLASVTGSFRWRKTLRESSLVTLASKTISSAGGTIEVSPAVPNDRARFIRLEIPAGALSADTQISISLMPPQMAEPDRSLVMKQLPFRLEPSGVTFLKPVRLTIPISPEVINNNAELMRSLSLFTLNEATRRWEAWPVVAVDVSNYTITFELSHFSDQVVGGRNSLADDLNSYVGCSPDLDAVLGCTTDVAQGLSLLIRNSEVPGISLLTDSISAAAEGARIAKLFEQGKSMEAWARINQFVARTALDALCEIGSHQASPLWGVGEDKLAFVCSQFANVVVNASEQLANKTGNWLGDVTNEIEYNKLQSQIQRYLGWRRSGKSRGEVPRCDSGKGWFPDPNVGRCEFWDQNCFIGNSTYPCGTLYGTLYTPEFAISAGEQQLLHEQQIKDGLTNLTTTVRGVAAALVSKYGRDDQIEARISVSPVGVGVAPYRVTFEGGNSRSSRGLKRYLWNIDNSNSFEGTSSMSHAFLTEGLHRVTLTVEDSSGRLANSTATVVVLPSLTGSRVEQDFTVEVDTTSVRTPGSATLSTTSARSNAWIRFFWSVGGTNKTSPEIRASSNGSASHRVNFERESTAGEYTMYAQEVDGRRSNSVRVSVSDDLGGVAISQVETSPSNPAAGREFRFTVVGDRFNVANAQVQFSGPGCSPCVVPTGALTKSATQISGPATLNIAGNYNVTVRNGSSGVPSNAISLSVEGFSISVDATSRTITLGQNAAFTLAVQSTGGFSLPISITAINLPTGSVAGSTNWTQQTVTPPASGTANTTLTIATNSSTATGTHTVTLRASRSGFPTQEIPVTVTINPASAGGFTISVDTNSRTITQGQSATFTLAVQSTGGFSSPVSIAAINLPSGSVAGSTYWTQETMTPLANGTANTTLTIATNSSTVTGTHTVTLRASRSGFPTREVPVTVTINPASAGGFTTSANATSRTVTQGQSTSFTLTIQSAGGFSQQVDVYGIGMPGGSTSSWSQEHVTPAANGSVSTTLTINTSSSTATGTFPVILRAASAGYPTREITVNVTVNSSTPASFTTSANATSRTVTQGQSTSFTLTIQSVGGFSQQVDVYGIGMPGGSTSSWSQEHVTPAANGSVSTTLTINTSSSTATGTFPVILRAASAGYPTREITVNVTVNSSTPASFTTSANATSRTVTQGQSTSFTLTIQSAGGFSQQVDVYGIGMPGGSTSSWSQEHVTPAANGSVSTTLTINTSSSTATGTFPVILRAASAGYPTREITVNVTVNSSTPASFTTSANATSRTVTQGQSTSFTLTIQSAGGFSQQVDVYGIGMPGGSTSSWSQEHVTPAANGSVSTTLTINTSSSTATGTFPVILRAASAGYPTREITVNVTVNSSTPASFTTSANATSRTVTQGQSTSFTLTIQSVGGFSQQVDVYGIGMPGGSTSSWSQEHVTPAANGSVSTTLTINTSSSTATGTFPVILRAASAGYPTREITVNVTVNSSTPASFTTSANATSRTVTQGQSTSFTLTIQSVGGFSQQVDVYGIGMPGGSTSSWSQEHVTPAANGSVSTTLTINTSSSTATGTFPVILRAASAGYPTREITVNVTVNSSTPASFTTSANATSRTVTQGQSTSFTLTIQSVGGFSQQVDVYGIGMPGGSTSSWSQEHVTPAANGSVSTTLTINTSSSTATGTFPVILRAASAGYPTREITVNVTVNSSTPASFTTSANATSRTVTQGQSTSFTLTIQSVGGFSQQVDVYGIGMPGGSTSSWSQEHVTPAANGSVSTTLTINTSSSTATGTFPVILRAASAGYPTREITVNVTVNSSTPASFTTSANATSRTVTQGQSTSFTLTIQSVGGFSQQVDVYGIGMPGGSTSSWSQEHVTPAANGSVSTTLTINTSSSTATGTFPVILRAASAGYPTREITVNVTVNSSTPASFTTSANATSRTVTQGQSTSFTLTIQSAGGFSQQVDVYGIGMPGGSTSSWSQEHVTPAANGSVSTTLTINTSSSTATGTFPVILRAASAGYPTREITVNVTVNSSTPASFTTSANATSRTVTQGQSTSFTLTIQSAGGFSQQVDVYGIGMPGGSTSSWSQEHVTPAANGSVSTTLTINTSSSTATGTFPVILRAASAGYPTREITVNVTVNSSTPASFTTSANATSRTVTQGQSTSFTLTIQSAGGFSQQVDVYGIGMPGGSTSSWSQEHVTPAANGSVSTTLTINTSSSTATGTFPVILRAASAGYPTREITVNVTVNSSGPVTPYVTGFNYSPNPARRAQIVNINIYGGNFISGTTQVWFVGPSCPSQGCQTNAVSVSGTAYISAQAQLNTTGSFTVNIRNGSSGTWVTAGSVTVVP